jgi:hypothetical protein
LCPSLDGQADHDQSATRGEDQGLHGRCEAHGRETISGSVAAMKRPKFRALVEHNLDEGDTLYAKTKRPLQRPLVANDSTVAFSRHTTSEPRTSAKAE